MSDAAPAYTIIDRNHENVWSDDLNRAVPSWIVKARWNATGTVLPVVLPDTHYDATNVDKAIRAAGALDEQIHALGT